MKGSPPDAVAVPRPLARRRRSTDAAPVAAEVPLPSRPDEELAVLAGEQSAVGSQVREAAFDELYRRYRNRVRKLVGWRFAGDDEGSEEVTQEVFFQLYRSLPRYAGRARFRTWLWSLVRNVCRHQLRRRRRGRRLGFGRQRAVERWQGTRDPVAEIPAAGPDAVERMTLGELRERVRREVARLPEVYRTTLLLRDWEEMSYVEIAEALAVPVGTVRSRLHKARALLASALQEDESDARRTGDPDDLP